MARESNSALRTLARISEPGPRSFAVKARLAQLGCDGFALALDQLARGAARGSGEDLVAMIACARFFVREGRPAAVIQPLCQSARRAGLRFAAAMLEDADEHKALTWLGRLRDVGGPSHVRRDVVVSTPATDGDEWRTRASYAAREQFVQEIFRPFVGQLSDALLEAKIASLCGVERHDLLTAAEENERAARLALMEPTKTRVPLPIRAIREQRRLMMRRMMVPEVLRRLLLDPEITLREVVTLAAMRPSSAPVVTEICRGWLERSEVRSALVQNPFTPTTTALLLVPTCRPRLRAILRANVHAKVHALAELCLEAGA